MPQRSPLRARLLAVPVALLLVATACGGDDDDDDAATTSEAADDTTAATTGDTAGDATAPTTGDTTASSSGDTGSGETYSADEYVEALVGEIGGDEEGSTCVAEALVDAVGAERLEASGAAPEDFAGAGALEDLGLGIEESAAPTLQSDLEACPSLVELFGEAADASEDEIACVKENVTQAQIAELFAVQFAGVAPSQELVDAQEGTQACFGN